MEKCLKKFCLVVVASFMFCLTLINIPTNIFAFEISQPKEKNVIVDVKGEGNVTLEENKNTTTITSDRSQSFSLENNTVLKFNVVSKEGFSIEQASVNGKSIQDFVSKSKDFIFEYTLAQEPLHFIFEFKKEEVKQNDSISAELLLDSSTLINKTGIPSQEELLILDDYKLGNTMKEEYVQKRKEIVERIHAQAFVDENYFITDKYMDTYGTLNLLKTLGATILVHPDYTYERSIELNETERSITNPTVTYLRKGGITNIDFGPNVGNVYGWGAVWKVNGHPAFCGQAMNALPQVGHKLTGLVEVTDMELKKAMYYGYQGPNDKLSPIFGYNESKTILAMNELVSAINSNTSIGGSAVSQRKHIIYNHVKAKGLFNNPAPPAEFKVYKAQDPNYGINWNGDYKQCQMLVFWKLEPQKGILNIKKMSANPTLTNNNPCYDLKGAEYGVYKTKGDAERNQNRVNTLVIGSSKWADWAQDIELDAGTYYVKETKAPKGFALNPKIVPVTVKAGERSDVGYNGEFTDYPQGDPVVILLGKVDKETNLNKPQGTSSLGNAQFTVKYYKGYYDTDPSKQGKTPERTWVLKTDNNGKCRLHQDYKISGDEFWLNSLGVASLPLGTITIQETKAPDGYYINPEVLVRKITSVGNAEHVNTYNIPTVKEQVVKLWLKKVQQGTHTLIPNAEFRHTKPNGTSEIIKTDRNGHLVLVGLTNGKHSLQEIKAPDGYVVNPTKIEFNVESNGKIKFLTNLSGTGISHVKDNHGDTVITMEDKVADYSIKLDKINDKHIELDKAEFTIYADESCSKVVDVQITQGGTLQFHNLKDRTHYYIKETKAPTGYRIPLDPTTNKPHVYHVYVESTPALNQFNFTIDGVTYTISNNNVNEPIHLEGTVANRVVSMQVINKITHKLPETGGMGATFIVLLGGCIMAIAMVFSKKNRNKENS